MKKTFGVFTVAMLTVTLLSCGNNAEDIVSKAEYDAVVSNLNSKNAELQTQLESVQVELESVQAELAKLKESMSETEEVKRPDIQIPEKTDEKEEGVTIASEPITVPDPSTQSEFVVELTIENFLSVFELKAVNRYDAWGEFDEKEPGFSSLLYAQGWALGKIENFEVDYSIFGGEKMRATNPADHKYFGYGEYGEYAEPDAHIYSVKGTVTFYPIGDVKDEVVTHEEWYVRYIKRTLPDGSEITLYTDSKGVMVY